MQEASDSAAQVLWSPVTNMTGDLLPDLAIHVPGPLSVPQTPELHKPWLSVWWLILTINLIVLRDT
jgi:hypothetical protein